MRGRAMEIRCEQCDARLTFREDRLKGAGPLVATCPKCGGRLNPDPATGLKNDDPTAPKEAVQRPKNGGVGPASLSGLESVEGKRLALVLESEPEQRESLNRALEALGYAPVNADGVRDAISSLRYHSFDLILLADSFETEPWEDSPFLNYLNSLPIGVRRRVFVALIGDDLKTRDPMAAFSLSVNLVIGRGHTADLGRILRQGIEENEAFYEPLMHTLAELRKR
jgi:hypothetical protein